MKRILLIGKRGFLGNHLNQYLRKNFQIKFISFGEIDCRKDEGILTYTRKKNKDISNLDNLCATGVTFFLVISLSRELKKNNQR